MRPLSAGQLLSGRVQTQTNSEANRLSAAANWPPLPSPSLLAQAPLLSPLALAWSVASASLIPPSRPASASVPIGDGLPMFRQHMAAARLRWAQQKQTAERQKAEKQEEKEEAWEDGGVAVDTPSEKCEKTETFDAFAHSPATLPTRG
jgi:hypothetical protein